MLVRTGGSAPSASTGLLLDHQKTCTLTKVGYEVFLTFGNLQTTILADRDVSKDTKITVLHYSLWKKERIYSRKKKDQSMVIIKQSHVLT